MTKDDMKAVLQSLFDDTHAGGYAWIDDTNAVRNLLSVLIEMVERLPEGEVVNKEAMYRIDDRVTGATVIARPDGDRETGIDNRAWSAMWELVKDYGESRTISSMRGDLVRFQVTYVSVKEAQG